MNTAMHFFDKTLYFDAYKMFNMHIKITLWIFLKLRKIDESYIGFTGHETNYKKDIWHTHIMQPHHI